MRSSNSLIITNNRLKVVWWWTDGGNRGTAVCVWLRVNNAATKIPCNLQVCRADLSLYIRILIIQITVLMIIILYLPSVCRRHRPPPPVDVCSCCRGGDVVVRWSSCSWFPAACLLNCHAAALLSPCIAIRHDPTTSRTWWMSKDRPHCPPIRPWNSSSRVVELLIDSVKCLEKDSLL